MIRKVILLLSILVSLGSAASAQWCITSEQLQTYKEQSPEIEVYNAQLEAHIKAELQKMALLRSQLKTTADPTDTLHIPVVFHIVHDYGTTDYVSDNTIYNLLDDINDVYMKRNADTSNVIGPFKNLIGNPKIVFHLATKDPLGRPTTGITRKQSLLTNGGDDQAKFGQWAPDSYLNIWVIQRIGRGVSSGVVAAYATFPASAAARPYTDGIIASASQLNTNKTIPHEIGHCLDLIHPWGNTQVATACGGDDEVDDTPPTTGHYSDGSPFGATASGSCGPTSLYDTTCTNNVNSRAKIQIDSTLGLASSTATDAGIEFDAKARLVIQSVNIYPTTTNDPFTIQLQQWDAGTSSYTVVSSVNGTTKATIDRKPQEVALNMQVNIGNGYRLIMTTNPGMSHDSVNSSVVYSKSIANVIDIKTDIKNGRYNFMYNWVVRYFYLANGVDYPDTVNTQNIMDYANCPIMFTKLQVERMRAALSSDVGRRNNLVKDSTHVKTGILSSYGGKYDVKRDMKPVPDYSIERPIGVLTERTYFLCADGIQNFRFRNRSWRDTVTSVSWEFSNGASIPTSINGATTVTNTFTTPGWVTVKLTATGNNTGDSTIERQDVYAADPGNQIQPLSGYFQEFDPNGDVAQWPMFNYYKNAQKWQTNSKYGFYDNNSIMYSAYDTRSFPTGFIGSPKGDYDDFFSRAFDLSNMNNDCNLNFMSSGALRALERSTSAGNPLISDTLEISYSTNCGANWTKLKDIHGSELYNKGLVSVQYAPLWQGDWKLQSIEIPNGARTSQVYFRFRYKVGTEEGSVFSLGVGNNFYMDRINVSPFPLGVNTLLGDNNNIAVAPNPTSGDAFVVIKNNQNNTASVIVTDITGKVVYQTQEGINNGINRIQIPAATISVKGVYLVKVVTGEHTQTQKLVVQ